MKNFISDNLENMIADLRELVSYKSVYAEDEKPFGSENRKVLDAALKMMEKVGLRTKNLDYYCGYGEVGEGDEVIGILSHLDVVPEGDGWDSDPYTLIEKDGLLYGRGSTDDKGSVIANLYALKYLIDSGYRFKKRVRLIVGCNEESGSECIRHYVEKEGHIDMGYTPDADFPGIYAEKGMIGGVLVGHKTKIKDIRGGQAPNIVCNEVECLIDQSEYDVNKLEDYFRENNIKYLLNGDSLTVYGVAAHASMPSMGVNAISHLFEALYYADINDEFIDFFHRNFALTYNGELIGYKDIEDDISDATINFGIAFKEGDDIKVTLDMRFPVRSSVKECMRPLENIKDESNEFVSYSCVEPLYFDIDSPFIKALDKAYRDVTGDYESKMEAIGGGTYAKAIHNCIAFGPEMHGTEYHIHGANECMSIEELKKQVEIYVEAIKNLNEV